MARQCSNSTSWNPQPLNGITSENKDKQWASVSTSSGPRNLIGNAESQHEIVRPKPRRYIFINLK